MSFAPGGGAILSHVPISKINWTGTVRLTDQYFFFLLSVDGTLRFEIDMVEAST